MRRSLFALALVLALAPATAEAQSSLYRFELTPTASFRWGGEITGADDSLFETDLDVESGSAFGVTLGIPLSSRIQLELLASRQQTEVGFERGLFGGTAALADFDVTYYHVGLLWQWGDARMSPFVVASVGATNLDPDLPGATSEDRFSLSIGGGVKVFLSDHVGLRFEGRGFFTDLDGDDHHHGCDDFYGYYDDCYDPALEQGQASVGLILAW